ncbi:hypothetical protein V6N13_139771 [Hibiscus sabdariffa]|uniref:Uncharacterized protein n=2 Tax=Hibiscus sabdariffa TaxID=183260 RepID=A0ABR2C762_9ROSI
MEPNEIHHQQHYFTTTSTTITATPSPTNGLLPRNDSGDPHPILYPHSVPPAVTLPVEPARRKRGRPRKYGTPEQAMAAKKTTSLSSKERREQQQLQQLALGGATGSVSGSSKKSQLVALGNAGQSFTPHIINVVAGEDVGQKIMMFVQRSKHEICILSASGTISNASLRQPATSGSNIAHEGQFEIISLSGSYVRTEIGGRTGGLSVCLSSADGQIIGGGVGGPLKAAGPVQVIVGTFMIDNKKDVSAGAEGDATGSRLPSPVGGASASNVGFRPAFENPGGNPIRRNDDPQSFGGSHLMMQPRGTHFTPRSTDWRTELDDRVGFELTG